MYKHLKPHSEETQKHIPPKRMRKKPDNLSRRQFLLGMGLLGAGALTCGGLGLSASLLSSVATPAPSPKPPTAEVLVQMNTAAPRFERPVTISRQAWGAEPIDHNAPNENGFYSPENREGWRVYEGNLEDVYQTLLIHHSAFYEETDLQTVRTVQTEHFRQRGWADIGYHFCVGQTGIIYEGRDWNVRGTHVEGYNTGSLGICLLGNFMQQSPTEPQLQSTQALINWLAERLTISHIASHRHFNPQTECPGDNLFIYMGQFAAVAGLELGTGGYVAPEDGLFCPCCSPRVV
jgi:hypothetical protein